MRHVSLTDKYEIEEGVVCLSGKQALARVPLLQRRLDESRGWRTAGYVSGYRGSPLGTMDHELGRISDRLDAAGVIFEPGLNEDLALTAVWGSQQTDFVPGPAFDGVFGMWYGKGPGVDRSGDAIRHLNMSGTHPMGGVLLCFGDDHPGKSSSLAHQSDLTLAALEVPVLYPADVGDVLRFALLGIALSRDSGLAVGLKMVNETADATEVIGMSLRAMAPAPAPDPGPDRRIRPEMLAVAAQDARMVRHKLPAVHPFTRRNRVDRVAFGSERPHRLGIVTAGKSWRDTIAALRLLGIDDATARAQGIGVLKVGLIWPLDPEPLTAFAAEAPELLFVEEKRAHMESQAARLLWHSGLHPAISGKTAPDGAELIAADRLLYPADIARAIAARLPDLPGVAASGARLAARAMPAAAAAPAGLSRPPMFCSGCPHNRSTRLPDGSHGVAGIGCHGLVQFMDRNPLPCTHMGAEGVNWVGLSRFTKTPHVFVNLGDGTYSHSGSLAIRAAAASPANVTYKILVNDVVAMTGGQPVESAMSVGAIARQVRLDGAREVVVVAEDPAEVAGLPPGTRLLPRTALDRVQRDLRDTPGTTVLIYVQTCATERHRRRKHGTEGAAARRAVIHPMVCEGCGDCSRASNCASVQPLETEFGRKRRIDQSSCNADMTCAEGFCPSFLILRGTTPRRPEMPDFRTPASGLPLPSVPALPSGGHGILLAGIGGTGVVTTSAILAMAAHMEGMGASVYDMTGLAQKGGSVYSHLRLLPAPGAAIPYRLGQDDADVVIASDVVAAAQAEALQTIRRDTRLLVDPGVTAPQAFHERPDIDLSGRTEAAALVRRTDRPPRMIEAGALSARAFGDPVQGNLVLIGAAWQLGLVPLPLAAIEAAITLNGASVDTNLQALALGRLVAADHPAVRALDARIAAAAPPPLANLADRIALRVDALTAYQGSGLSSRYALLVDKVRRAEARVRPGSDALTVAVMEQAFRVMAIKDEYEVCRLWSDPAIWSDVAAGFQGGRAGISLAPPGAFLRRRGAKLTVPARLARPAMAALARMKVLRGTPFDPFGYSAERRAERALRDLYLDRIERAADGLSADSYDAALRLALIPARVRGYGHVKAPGLAAALAALETGAA